MTSSGHGRSGCWDCSISGLLGGFATWPASGTSCLEHVKWCESKTKGKETCRNALNIERVPGEICERRPGARISTDSTGTRRCRTSIHCSRLHFGPPCCGPYCSRLATASDPSENKASLACKYKFQDCTSACKFCNNHSTLQPTTEKACESYACVNISMHRHPRKASYNMQTCT